MVSIIYILKIESELPTEKESFKKMKLANVWDQDSFSSGSLILKNLSLIIFQRAAPGNHAYHFPVFLLWLFPRTQILAAQLATHLGLLNEY